ncbi:MAG: FAD-binding oxidoreductase [Polyangiaceae bacterium]|nr:FAD-binding oxidoreductase [Polyangiaceae bacterium]
METTKEALGRIVGSENVVDAPGVLAAYAKDESLVPPLRPWFVARPGNATEVQKLVVWANETGTPLVAVSSGPPHFHGDTVPSAPEAVIVDLGRMKAIQRIDRRNRIAVIEPGVTYSELDAALTELGLCIPRPLSPRSNKSVVASLLERQPTLIPRLQYSLPEPLRTCGVVWGTGEIAFTGEAGGGPASLDEQWQRGLAQVDPKGPLATDLMRLLTGAQGSMGIVVWASVRLQLLPAVHRFRFVPAQQIGDLLEFCRKLLRTRLGDEVVLLNAGQFARLLAKDAGEAARLALGLPPWCVVIGLGGAAFFPEQRVAVAEKDLEALAQACGLRSLPGLPGVGSAELGRTFRGCSEGTHWKLREKGAATEIFFLTTLDKVPGFIDTVNTVARSHPYPAHTVGVYVQPQHAGTAQHVEFTLPFDPGNRADVETVRVIQAQASRALARQGAYFSRPYGAWADLVYSRDAAARTALRTVKRIVDPQNILNPGKLCF